MTQKAFWKQQKIRIER